MTGGTPSLAARLVLVLMALTLFWAPLSHAGPCEHDAGIVSASDIEAAPEAAPAEEAGEAVDGAHLCSCTGCHFHGLAQAGHAPRMAGGPERPKPDLRLRPAAAAPGDLLRPPRA